MHQLKDLAYARSGDKGDVSNIGVIAHSLEAYGILREYLTPERIKAHFGTLVKGDVEVYEMPNILFCRWSCGARWRAAQRVTCASTRRARPWQPRYCVCQCPWSSNR